MNMPNIPQPIDFIKKGKRVLPREIGVVFSDEEMLAYRIENYAIVFGNNGDALFKLTETKNGIKAKQIDYYRKNRKITKLLKNI